ncbi:hypothetical protein [Biformimicrobium ophioploci]|uniref:Hemoglobin n=1 Tax=Biformimicrobium ophioploci TaxID=3036711 RepID=A0ABQ6M1Z9_9GAMM|nr:hypothetical protein [Microbulbifer sp. NKW57]GMG88336.1 hypothetical protein MNKW57_26570 [Microbulbifer sp. NKW57]
MESLLENVGGPEAIDQTVGKFYQAVGRHLCEEDTTEHSKQQSRQSKFLIHALSPPSDKLHRERAGFLARGLNPFLFDALLEYLEGFFIERGVCADRSSRIIDRITALFYAEEQRLAMAS